MTSAEVRAQVEAQIGNDWDRKGSHGLDLRRSIVEPRRVRCTNTFPNLDGGRALDLWIVLEETPGRQDGYLIVFDDRNGKFGLADWSEGTAVFLGYHGTFLDTLDGM